MKKIKYFVFFLVMFLFNITISKANTIDSIYIDVTLDEEGNGHIQELWNMYVDRGTENFKPMTNLENSTISDFTVSDETGNIYTFLSTWNTNGTLASKAYKNGFNYIDDGVELCWGMSKYGYHTYVVSYTVSNMIYNVDDTQILYFRFLNDGMDPAPKQFSITISGPNDYEDTLAVWGFGYEGYAYVSNGSIFMSNSDERNFQSNEYAVVLVKYPINTFATDNYTSKFHTFDEVLTRAMVGSTPYKQQSNSFFRYFTSAVMSMIQLVFMTTIVMFFFKNVRKNSVNYTKKSINKKEVQYFRDIPCQKDLFKAYFLSDMYNLNRKKEDLLGAIILKWLKDKKVRIVKQEKKKWFGKKANVTAIDLTIFGDSNNPCEQELYNMMNKASKDGLLEENELKRWCSSNYNKFFKWFDKALDYVRNQYVDEGKITITEKGKFFKSKQYHLNNELSEEAMKLAGLKKYLQDFSLIHEKEPLEVMLWQEYLIYAQIFGIAKQVAKDFKKIYPDLIEQSDYFNYTSIIWIDTISSHSISSASSARSSAESYSSGGGGFSSSGGGGGSFGGGSGGGCR